MTSVQAHNDPTAPAAEPHGDVALERPAGLAHDERRHLGALVGPSLAAFVDRQEGRVVEQGPGAVGLGRELVHEDAQPYLGIRPGLAVYPAIAIIITALSFTLLGEAMREALDPKLRK